MCFHPFANSLRASLSLSLAAMFFATSAMSAEPEKPKLPTLTRAELRACMAQKDEIDTRRIAFERDVKAHEEAGVAISRETEALNGAKDAVDTKNAEAVTAYNDRIAARNKSGEAHNARAAAVNASGVELQALQQRYIDACSEKPFMVGDREAVMKERAAAAGASAVKR